MIQGERLLSSRDVSLLLLSTKGKQDITLPADETAKALIGQLPVSVSSAIAVARSARGIAPLRKVNRPMTRLRCCV